MKLFIKNMVCNRCKMMVRSELEKLGLHLTSLELGEVEIQEENIDDLEERLLQRLQSSGLDLIYDEQTKTIEKIKNLIIELVHHADNDTKFTLSDYLTQHFSKDYHTLSHLFSETEGMTIEKYFICQKVEKVKELLSYDQLSLSEIAYRLRYSSASHLSNQFKKVTGFTPTDYRQLKDKQRKQIDDF